MRISDRSSDVCSSDLPLPRGPDWNAGTAAQSPHSPPLSGRSAVTQLVSQSVHISEGVDISGQARVDVHVVPPIGIDRKSVATGKRVSGRVEPGGVRIIKKKESKITLIINQ